MDKNVKRILYKIQDFSYSILLVRLIALGASINFILIFNNDPYFNGFIILFFAFIMLIAEHGWDVDGLLWLGWRAAFVNRRGQQIFRLAPKIEITESDLQKIAKTLVTYKNVPEYNIKRY
ncbi:hypothetical protein JBL43_19755 [Aureibaculum sp. A20]|uniref:Uncharacterized protein n=1 Tax=Aureibaculum flavum TaxID=2795986 RepID=A0ABS0WWW4_9FLAO|nr:hypothetical protein [Aureibaculum flavum]MBJ2176494.1 hypothetical protein [Aureibaculum flavum]